VTALQVAALILLVLAGVAAGTGIAHLIGRIFGDGEPR